MFGLRETRVLLKGQAKEAYIDLKKRSDKEAQILFIQQYRSAFAKVTM